MKEIAPGIALDPEMDRTIDMDLVKGSRGISYWFTTISDIPRDFFIKYIKGKRFIDLGCGDGRVVFLAMRCGASTFRGIEIDEELIKKSNMRRYIKKGDFHDIDFNKYDVLYHYLFSDSKREFDIIEKLKDFKGYFIIYYRKVAHRLPRFHDEIIKRGFKEIEKEGYLKVYRRESFEKQNERKNTTEVSE